METGEPIKDATPLIYTPKEKGVMPQYDVRADKWEIAQNAMDRVNKERIAKGQQPPSEEVKKIDTAQGGAIKDGVLLGKAIRWYHSTATMTAIHYAKNNNKVPKSDGAKPVMNYPNFPNDPLTVIFSESAVTVSPLAFASKRLLTID